ncbi:short-subunit dehydrogenase [Balneicella halophila]|uniref:Short-subunit dehydrogenase n=1 Tax=Balneicella halophila TaxID=1537566 RepID=A0A7L4US04_BALHA|nr:SDR family oxidoreductase [Balneicella halophila]PVX52439.1 short-subunit dehydrogenase [Balneicella halophila]
MKNLEGKNVLITGGASGIGKILVHLMLERKANVIIWDISQDNINKLHNEMAQFGAVRTYLVDVSKIDMVQNVAKKVKSDVGVVDVLINNAGIVVGKYFHEQTPQNILKTMEINAMAPMFVTKQFLNDMMKQNSGHICNIASSAGLISNPQMSVYAASKWSVVGWSDSLRLEMEKMKKNVKVTTIMPYYIDTGMFEGVRSKIPILKPEPVAHKIIKAIEKDKKMVTIPGYIYNLTRLGQAILPTSLFDWVVNNVLGIYKTMEDFTGRK